MKWLRISLSLTVIVCLLLILVNAGRWLVIDQPPRKSDVIIVLSGDPARTQMGINLYRLGYAPYLLFTRSDSSMESEAIGQGVPARAIIPEERADSTYENALYSKALMKQYGLHSALVVSYDTPTPPRPLGRLRRCPCLAGNISSAMLCLRNASLAHSN